MNKKLKTLIKIIIIKCIPAKKNIIVFTSYDGLYSDSPKYISEKLHELNKEYEIIWLVNEDVLKELPNYVKGVIYNSWNAVIKQAQASVLIDNGYGGKANILYKQTIIKQIKFKIIKFLNRKTNQKLYTTWHGTPLKKMGRDQINNTIYDFDLPNTTFILNNKYTLDIMKHLTFHRARMLLMGVPRNDILYSKDRIVIEATKKHLHIPMNKRVVLYAPTFRNDGKNIEGKNINRSGINQLAEMDINKLLENLSDQFDGEWILVCRFHYFVSSMVDWEVLHQKYDGKILNGNQDGDMAKYLLCSDVLISDVSSCMFDYMITKRPCFIYFPDYERYKNKERGLYYDIKNLPFPFSVDFQSLIDNIKKFDEKEYIRQLEILSDKFSFCDRPNTAEHIAKLIIEENPII